MDNVKFQLKRINIFKSTVTSLGAIGELFVAFAIAKKLTCLNSLLVSVSLSKAISLNLIIYNVLITKLFSRFNRFYMSIISCFSLPDASLDGDVRIDCNT